MKIKKVSIEKLFGVFDYDIPVNNKSGITIIIGENGLGKTILLEMLDAFFKGKYFYFNSVTFKEFILVFDDGVKWVLKKKEQKDNLPILNLIQINKNNKSYLPIRLMSYQPEDIERLAIRESRRFPFIRRIGSRIWEDRRTRKLIRLDELINRFGGHSLHDDCLSDSEKPKWFTKRHEKINVSLIKTQRLISIEEREEITYEKTVDKYSKELSEKIKLSLTESTELSSKLDRTYPNRLIYRLKQSLNVADKHLFTELKRLEEKRELLDRVGLIEIEKDPNILEITKSEKIIKDVLMLYVEDSFEKIKIFDGISKKIEILLSIINKRFKHKKFFVDRDQGFLFRSTIIKDNSGEYKSIPVSKLSSGEQNELVLFYELLFKSKSSSLILIDEPEVSLHISWQNCFIEDLKEIASLNNLRFIIATHSPDIISNNWDLKVELKGLE
jgi:predicted ATP-binding protein involved in virulence